MHSPNPALALLVLLQAIYILVYVGLMFAVGLRIFTRQATREALPPAQRAIVSATANIAILALLVAGIGVVMDSATLRHTLQNIGVATFLVHVLLANGFGAAAMWKRRHGHGAVG